MTTATVKGDGWVMDVSGYGALYVADACVDITGGKPQTVAVRGFYPPTVTARVVVLVGLDACTGTMMELMDAMSDGCALRRGSPLLPDGAFADVVICERAESGLPTPHELEQFVERAAGRDAKLPDVRLELRLACASVKEWRDGKMILQAIALTPSQRNKATQSLKRMLAMRNLA